MTISRARPEQAARLTEIAFAAKRHWEYPEAWIEAWRGDLTLTPSFIETHDVFAAAEGDEIVGLYALGGEGKRRELEHFWVWPAAMGRGVGRALFAHAMDQAAAGGATELLIDADPNAEAFYLRMGAERIGERVSRVEGTRRARPLLRRPLRAEP